MHFKYKCPICGDTYDGMDSKCPNCGEPNASNKSAVKNPAGANFPFWKQLVVFFVGWAGFQILAYCIIFALRGYIQATGTTLESSLSSSIVNYGAYFLLIIALSLIAWKDWTKLFASFKNWKAYVFGIAGLAAIMVFSNFWNIIVQLIPIEVTTNANQSAANSIVTAYPVLGVIVLGLVGPICEELTYRVGLFSFTKRINRVFGYIVTLLIFGLIHFDFESVALGFSAGNWGNLWNELLNLPFYLFAGGTFCFLYEKFGFASSLTAHVANNLYSVIATLISAWLAKQGA